MSVRALYLTKLLLCCVRVTYKEGEEEITHEPALKNLHVILWARSLLATPPSPTAAP